MATIDDFEKIDIRVGKIIDVQDFPKARKPAYQLSIDFGPEVGVKRSSAQITDHYSKRQLINTLVLGVVNFPPRQIGSFSSEVLTLGTPDGRGGVWLVRPNKAAIIGGKLY